MRCQRRYFTPQRRWLVSRVILFVPVISLRCVLCFPQLDPVQVVESAHAAHGGHWDTETSETWEAHGVVTYFEEGLPARDFPIVLLKSGDDRVQRRIDQSGGLLSQGTDGEHEWDSLNGLFFSRPVGGVEAFIQAGTRRWPSALFRYRRRRQDLKYRGSSGAGYVVEAIDRGASTTYFIDRSTFRITALEFEAGTGRDPFQGKKAPDICRVEFVDYRMVQGILTPFRTRRFLNGIPVESMRFDSVTYGVTLDNSEFQP